MTGRVWIGIPLQGTPVVAGVLEGVFIKDASPAGRSLLLSWCQPIRGISIQPCSSCPRTASANFHGFKLLRFQYFLNFAFNYYLKILVSYFNDKSNYFALFTFGSAVSITEVAQKIFGDQINEWSLCRKLGLMRPLSGAAPDYGESRRGCGANFIKDWASEKKNAMHFAIVRFEFKSSYAFCWLGQHEKLH